MKRLLIMLCALSAFSACQKVDHNDDLGGFWQLTARTVQHGTSAPIETLATSGDRVFWTVQLNLLRTERFTDGVCFHSYFTHRGDSLFIGTSFQRPDDTPVSPSDTPAAQLLLQSLGVPRDGKLRITQLTAERLVLRHRDTTLTFRRY